MRKHLGLMLVLGLVVAVFVSACGVALAPVQFSASGSPIVSVPVISGLHLPAIQQPAAAHSLNEQQRFQTSVSSSLFHSEFIGCHSLQ